MSSTKGTGLERDNYPTPVAVVEELLSHLTLRPTDLFLEPCRGSGNIYDRIDLPREQKYHAELEEGKDYLMEFFPPIDVIITNPPFSLTEEFLRKAFLELTRDGTLCFLQRVNFLGSKIRVEFWAEIGFPQKTPVIIPRPRFIRGGSDSCEYMWMIWDRGNRFPTIPNGISHIITGSNITQTEDSFLLQLGAMKAKNPKALLQLVCYDNPLDYPSKYVVRAALVTSDGLRMTELHLVADSEAELHGVIPRDHFHWMPRLKEDDPCILGVYT